MTKKKSLVLSAPYDKLEADEKKKILTKFYVKNQLSWAEIAKELGTYPNKVRRDANLLGIKSRTKSDAQALALSSGRHDHPTKGKVRPEDTKIKISEKMANVWENLDDTERERRSEMAKKQWENMSDAEKENFRQAATKAILVAAREGSKLEKYLYQKLLKLGYFVEFHKTHVLINDKLHLDLYLPKIRTVIEVDGPSHHSPIWGEEVLHRNQRADTEKTGIILGHGLVMIRVKSTQSLSAKYQRDITAKLIEVLQQIEKQFPERTDRYIVLGE